MYTFTRILVVQRPIKGSTAGQLKVFVELHCAQGYAKRSPSPKQQLWLRASDLTHGDGPQHYWVERESLFDEEDSGVLMRLMEGSHMAALLTRFCSRSGTCEIFSAVTGNGYAVKDVCVVAKQGFRGVGNGPEHGPWVEESHQWYQPDDPIPSDGSAGRLRSALIGSAQNWPFWE
ncbi:hypothetical protein K438DRAFT_1753565 [Mycena galopus ATCC 62051]|nr:hypothetical protein K438DRAFT_1753565 [Mycena galopus ATCC 62051]